MLDELGIQMGEEMAGLVPQSGSIGTAASTGPSRAAVAGEDLFASITWFEWGRFTSGMEHQLCHKV